MRSHNGLKFLLPVLTAIALLLGGCYTMLRHPNPDPAEVTQGGFRDSDCASCHEGDFAEPLVTDAYGYAAQAFQDYYGCPWWLPDCGLIGVPLYSGYDPNGKEVGPVRIDASGRYVGGRGGIATGLPRFLPPTQSIDASSQTQENTPLDESVPVSRTGQQPGRTMKQGETPSGPAPPPPPPDDKKAPPKEKPKDDKP